MSQNEPNWQFCLFDKDGQVLSDQNDGTNENISPNWTKANEEASKEKGSRLYLWSEVKNTVYKTKSDMISCRNREQKAEILKRYLLVNLTCTLLLHDSLQTKWRRAVRFVFDVKKHSALFGPAKVSKDNKFQQCR